jgi:hypothetical protein
MKADLGRILETWRRLENPGDAWRRLETLSTLRRNEGGNYLKHLKHLNLEQNAFITCMTLQMRFPKQ